MVFYIITSENNFQAAIYVLFTRRRHGWRRTRYFSFFLAFFKHAALFQGYEKLGKKVSYTKDIYVRIPVIPEINDNEEEMSAIAQYILSLGKGVLRVELLGYHDLGIKKYDALDLPTRKLPVPDNYYLLNFVSLFSNFGINAHIV
jgi:hypothetical protein